jgi:hypothetical protein
MRFKKLLSAFMALVMTFSLFGINAVIAADGLMVWDFEGDDFPLAVFFDSGDMTAEFTDTYKNSGSKAAKLTASGMNTWDLYVFHTNTSQNAQAYEYYTFWAKSDVEFVLWARIGTSWSSPVYSPVAIKPGEHIYNVSLDPAEWQQLDGNSGVFNLNDIHNLGFAIMGGVNEGLTDVVFYIDDVMFTGAAAPAAPPADGYEPAAWDGLIWDFEDGNPLNVTDGGMSATVTNEFSYRGDYSAKLEVSQVNSWDIYIFHTNDIAPANNATEYGYYTFWARSETAFTLWARLATSWTDPVYAPVDIIAGEGLYSIKLDSALWNKLNGEQGVFNLNDIHNLGFAVDGASNPGLSAVTFYVDEVRLRFGYLRGRKGDLGL